MRTGSHLPRKTRCTYGVTPHHRRYAQRAAPEVGIRLVVEAMDATGLGLTWRERVVLIILAETARDDTRLCWPGYEGDDERAAAFRRRVDCSRTQFYATVAALVSKGALKVEKHGHKGQQAVYRVLPPRASPVIHSVPETGTLSDPEASQKPGPINGSKGPGFEFKGSRFEGQRVPETGTPTPQVPQDSSNLSLSPSVEGQPREERETDGDDEDFSPAIVELIRAGLARAHAAISEDDLHFLGMWIEDEYHPRGMGWWRKIADNGDFPEMYSRWRDHMSDVERRSAVRASTLIDCSSCGRPMRPPAAGSALCLDCRSRAPAILAQRAAD